MLNMEDVGKAKKATLALFVAWKSSDRKFKVNGLVLFAVMVLNVAIVAMWRRAIDALWQLDMFFLLAMAAIFYVFLFLAPVAMYIMYIGAHRDLRQRRRDLETALADALLHSALSFTLIHTFFISNIIQIIP